MTVLTEVSYRIKSYAAREAHQFFNEKRNQSLSPKEREAYTKRAIEAQKEAKALEDAIVRSKLEAYYPEHRDPKDRRRKVAKAVFSYFSPSGVEWRKGFYAPVGTSEEQFWAIAPEVIIL